MDSQIVGRMTVKHVHGIHLFVQTLDKHWIKTQIETLIILMMILIGGSTLWRSNCFFFHCHVFEKPNHCVFFVYELFIL